MFEPLAGERYWTAFWVGKPGFGSGAVAAGTDGFGGWPGEGCCWLDC